MNTKEGGHYDIICSLATVYDFTDPYLSLCFISFKNDAKYQLHHYLTELVFLLIQANTSFKRFQYTVKPIDNNQDPKFVAVDCLRWLFRDNYIL